jgi:RNA polymerase sigma-70 factor (ECF subfamily)
VPAEPEVGPLIAACQQGDRGAFRLLFERYRHRVHRHARYVLNDDAAAKDATQAVFVRVWRALPRFDPCGDFGHWLSRITLNVCIDERARRGRYAREIPPETATQARQEHTVFLLEVQRALARLPASYSAVLVLRHFEGLDYQEIAAVLGCSMGTVASRLSRAHEALARSVAAEGGEG